ncbi:MAG: hypothetical protein ACP5XB_06400 [Isosphaeraceae bacterium]
MTADLACQQSGDDGALNRYGTLGVIVASLSALAILTLSGCSGSSAHAVDTPRARDALVTALDHWKSGDQPRSVTSMTIQDFEWQDGAKLLDYKLLGDGQARGANLSIKVKLTLSPTSAKSKKLEKDVYYLVGTSPSVTVFRDMLRR